MEQSQWRGNQYILEQYIIYVDGKSSNNVLQCRKYRLL